MTTEPQQKPDPQLPHQVGAWVVTPVGLESRVEAGPERRLVEYVVERDRLLRQRPGAPGVSDWAMQLAAKTWVDSAAANTAMIEAVEVAIRHHHPDQQAIDFEATRRAAEDEWFRTHRRTLR